MAAMVGRWQFCSGGEHWHTWAPPDVVGVEFTPPNGPAFEGNGTSSGDVYYLVAGADGSPVRGSGNAYHLRYDLVSRNQVDILTPQGSAFFANLRYSSCPRQLELQLMYKPKATLHVPIVDGDRPVPPPLAACPSTSAAAPAMSADDFCAYFLADCGTNYAGYASFAECASSYEANTIDREICQSYHVCNAHVVEGAARAVHCPHAAGLAVCTQTR